MGCCLSKTDPCSKSIPSSVPQTQQNDPKKLQKLNVEAKVEQKKTQIGAFETKNPEERENGDGKIEVLAKKKKEVFVIQHRKSNRDSDGSGSNNSSNSSERGREVEEVGRNIMAAAASGQVVRTSSCTKEEVDAILIQCGRLSRSSSGKGNGNGRRYCGSKRSFDFDRENEIVDGNGNGGNGNDELIEVSYEEDERTRRRQSRGSNRRRTTPSRSRERDQQQQRSGSRERSQSNGRRISRSPARRSESPITHSTGNGNGNGNVRPAKLVSVPATVTSLSVEKTNNGNNGNGNNGNGNGGDNGNVKRVLVKRNVGSPRSQSPARAANQGNGNGNGGAQQQGSLSRNGSRKAEHSPYRRTPLNEIDVNSLPFHPLSNKRAVHKGKETEEDILVVKQPITYGSQQNKYSETNNGKAATQGTHRRTNSRGAEGYEITKTNYCRVNEHQQQNVEQTGMDKREPLDASEYDAMVTPVVFSGTDTLKLPQKLTRSRSGRRSRDLDINVEALLTPTPATNYNSLLLQDIQNFHQKKSSNANGNGSSSNNSVGSNIDASTPFTLPPCVSKACSILEAVADLNSMTGTDEDRRKSPRETNLSFHSGNKRVVESKDPFVESEVKVGDDLMEPRLHKYVTVRKRGAEMDDEESSGSNSYVGGIQQNWVSSTSWEPTSADSTDCWTSKSCSRDELSPVGFQRHAISDFAGGINEDSERKVSKGGAVRARTVASRGPISTSKAAAASM
ncbi:hypothetical protein BVRB_4g094620 isoform A [Beta vulgaris subsp. vulgaris]|nr:hypothetical protein BVRB_4g094620 isoform A [Beta vulgaris subsp. vulgaris]